jgi:hypothetical protein
MSMVVCCGHSATVLRPQSSLIPWEERTRGRKVSTNISGWLVGAGDVEEERMITKSSKSERAPIRF